MPGSALNNFIGLLVKIFQAKKILKILECGNKHDEICLFHIVEDTVCGLLQWLPEQMECGNAQIGKSAVALWIPMT